MKSRPGGQTSEIGRHTLCPNPKTTNVVEKKEIKQGPRAQFCVYPPEANLINLLYLKLCNTVRM